MGVPAGQSSRRGQCVGASPSLSIHCTSACVWTDTHMLVTRPHHNQHNQHNHNNLFPFRLQRQVRMMAGGEVDGEGAARRRRERRLRSWLKHERQSVARPCPSTSTTPQETEEGQGRSEAPRRQKPPPPQGSRPPCLGEPRGPQARIQQRTMEQVANVVPMVQSLDIPVPQMVGQLADIMHFFDTLTPDPEQVIEVPKILPDKVPMRTSVRDTQLVEQLVEVPTIISFSSLQRTMEQHVDIPVPWRAKLCSSRFSP